MWLLARGGRAIGEEAGGGFLHRGVCGMKIAIPYAIVSAGPSWAMRFHLELPGTNSFTVHPSRPAALLWPLLISAIAGFVGGISSAREDLWHSDWWESLDWAARWRGALAGGVAMLVTGLAVSVIALCALAVARPHDAATFLHGVFDAGPVSGAGVLLLAVAMLPNAAVWILHPAMGGCLTVTGGAGGSLPPYCFLSTGTSVGHPLRSLGQDPAWGFPALGGPPRFAMLFLLIPLVAVCIGALRAVRKADARNGRQGALAGLFAGLVFAALFTAATALATVTVRMEGSLSNVATGFLRYGPYPAYGFGLALAWGVVGGAAIGGLAGRLRRSG
jgi:hypothetical protein